MHYSDDHSLCLPLSTQARQTALQFAQEQPTPEKAQQVQFNTLAVWVVNDYLQLMGIATNLAAGDSWNPVVRVCADVADLEVVGVGRLECRPVGPEAHSCPLPPEVWCDRLGYVVVRLHTSLHQATVLGFTPTAAVTDVPLTQLQPLESLLAHISEFRVSAPQAMPAPTWIHLSQWLAGKFDHGWQAADTLLSPNAGPAFSFRSAGTTCAPELDPPPSLVKRAKLMDLGPLSNLPLALVVDLQPEGGQKLCICVQAHPTGGPAYLPPNLQLMVLDDTGMAFLEAQSRQADNYIQLQFSGQPGEKFSVMLAAQGARVVEQFVI